MQATFKTICAFMLFLIGLVLVLDGLVDQTSSASTILNGTQTESITGGGCDPCAKSTYCGSVYCERIQGSHPARYQNCSGNTQKKFCVNEGNSGSKCDVDGESVSCGVFQVCGTSSCSSCEPGSSSCSRTGSGDDDTACP